MKQIKNFDGFVNEANEARIKSLKHDIERQP